jgi:hypothetical protein
MAVAFRSSVREFIAPSDSALPADQQTVWLLRPLDVFDNAEVADAYSDGTGGNMRRLLTYLRLSLVGWRNFKDESGADVPFVGLNGRATDEDIRKIPTAYAHELVKAIFEAEAISRKQAGE